jgi:hypothetical protein
MSFESHDSPIMSRELKVQRLVIPFTVTASTTPALVVLRNDEPSILFLQSQGVNQINNGLPAGSPTPPPGSPNLGTASTYEILAASAVTNTGSSIITGDLGLSPGTSVTGFPPGVVVGTEHITDAAAAQAQVDALAAYTDLFGRSATSISANLDGQTLSAGVYTETSGTFNLATSGNATLTLNGSATDLFIFRCTSTLTTGAGGVPTILLTGGAIASNVYWVCGSSATINVSGSGAFVGTIIASASVTADGGSILGRMIALNAAVTLSAAVGGTVPSPVIPGVLIDANGTLNMLIKLQPDDRCAKVMRCSAMDRSTGIRQPVFILNTPIGNGIDANGNILLSMDSSIDFTTTDFNGVVDVDYVIED